jgi:hypothetical protein
MVGLDQDIPIIWSRDETPALLQYYSLLATMYCTYHIVLPFCSLRSTVIYYSLYQLQHEALTS